jgi:hypothetical protein
MRRILAGSVSVAVIVAGVFFYDTINQTCPVPLAYRLGTIDSHFSLTKEQAITHLATAEHLWEEAAGRDLFYYDENAALSVNFIFDERQAKTNAEQTERTVLDEQKAEYESVLATVEELRSEHSTLTTAYQDDVRRYESELQTYNDTVRMYNDRGGAPKEAFSELERTRIVLDTKRTKLQKTANELQILADKTNELGDRANQLIEAYNTAVESYNTQFGYRREFTQGDYDGKSIHIYTFSTDAELVRVLTHEFGHALGIDHVDDTKAIMYYLLDDSSTTPTLSIADTRALIAVCGKEASFLTQVHSWSRTIIKTIKNTL